MTHGFLGYKDYGMFPYLARTFAEAGLIAHRFNLSHSGMTNRIDIFERPDLFERDTWNKQVCDVDHVIASVAAGQLAGTGLPVVLWGHSRGGVTSILAAGRRFRERREPSLAGVITAAAPSECCRMDESQQDALLERGVAEVVSNRTGQTLRVDRGWLKEQLDDPVGHDVLAHAASIACPMLVVHGVDDPTVPLECMERLVDAISRGESPAVEALAVEGGDHVFNTPNPMPAASGPSRQLQSFADVSVRFALRCCGEAVG